MNIERNYYFDNLKSLLIFLVILAHGVDHIFNFKPTLKTALIIIYSFHMPLFIFISGYFSKLSSRTNKTKFISMLKLYLIAQFIYNLLYFYIIKPKNFSFTFVYPNWTLWYLLSLSVWYLISDYIGSFKKSLLIALVISFLIGFDKHVSTYMSLSRTITFLPYFIIGYYFDAKYIEKLKNHKFSLIILLFLATGLLYILRQKIDIRIFFNSYSYNSFNANKLFKGLYLRMFSYVIAFIMSIGIMVCVPKNKTIFSYFGKITLYLYLAHPCIIKLMIYFKVYKYTTKIQLITTLAIILLVTYITAIIIDYLLKFAKPLIKNKIEPKKFMNS